MRQTFHLTRLQRALRYQTPQISVLDAWAGVWRKLRSKNLITSGLTAFQKDALARGFEAVKTPSGKYVIQFRNKGNES